MSFKTGLLNLDYWCTCPTPPHSNTILVLPRVLFKVCNLLRLFFGNSRFLYLLFCFQDIHGRGCGVHDFILSHGLSYLPAIVFFFPCESMIRLLASTFNVHGAFLGRIVGLRMAKYYFRTSSRRNSTKDTLRWHGVEWDGHWIAHDLWAYLFWQWFSPNQARLGFRHV